MLVDDSLFATLDPTTRRTTTADGRVFTLSDTVGFVRHLPHQIVEAFRSTLEEVADADLILHVVDGSHPDPEGQISAVREVFAEVDAERRARDHRDQQGRRGRPAGARPAAARPSRTRSWSAPATGQGIDALRELVEGELPRPGVAFTALLPYERGDLINKLHQHGEIDSMEHTAEGTVVAGRANADLAGELASYAV